MSVEFKTINEVGEDVSAVLLCIYGSYLLTSNQTFEVQLYDGLLFFSGLFFAFQIILIDVFMKKFKSPFSYASIQ